MPSFDSHCHWARADKFRSFRKRFEQFPSLERGFKLLLDCSQPFRRLGDFRLILLIKCRRRHRFMQLALFNFQHLNALWQLEFKSSVPDEILAIRQQPMSNNFNEFLMTLGLTSSQTQFAREWFTTNSNTYSVWIDSPNLSGKSFTAIYVRRRSAGFADEQFGFHLP